MVFISSMSIPNDEAVPRIMSGAGIIYLDELASEGKAVHKSQIAVICQAMVLLHGEERTKELLPLLPDFLRHFPDLKKDIALKNEGVLDKNEIDILASIYCAEGLYNNLATEELAEKVAAPENKTLITTDRIGKLALLLHIINIGLELSKDYWGIITDLIRK
jgi:hypothetical protein